MSQTLLVFLICSWMSCWTDLGAEIPRAVCPNESAASPHKPSDPRLPSQSHELMK
jgi:hypothetical protein